MGNQLSASQNYEVLDRLLLSLENFTKEGQPIEVNKLFAIIKLSGDQNNLFLAKVYIKTKDVDIASYKQRFEAQKALISKKFCGNVLLGDYIENSKTIILLRQYCASTLRKKLIIPPFLNETEKLWISYQCLLAVKQLHDNKIVHGDIKSENFLITSWNWVFLSDVSSFYKPSYLVEGDLSSYKYFYSYSERPACYLSPEKFRNKNIEDPCTTEMDIFSLGCVIAEIFLDGKFLFTLPDLLSYKRSDLKQPSKISDIKNESIKEMIMSMISTQPDNRKSIDYYIEHCENQILYKGVPELYGFMADIMKDINGLTPWLRIQSVLDVYYKLPVYNNENLLILAEFITGNLRDVQYPSHKVLAIEKLVEIAFGLSEDSKLHRVLPYLITVLQNKQERTKVKVSCMKSIIKLLQNIKNISARDVHLFNEYIWPVFKSLIHDESDWVRSELAISLPDIAKMGRTFFEVSIKYSDANFNKELTKFSNKFIRIFKDMIVSKPESQVQIELLANFADLAQFLDMRSVLNNIIPIVLSWLNKGDSYRLLILTQVPKLLNIIHTPEFYSQIFTCIEDGLVLHNELVVRSTLEVFEESPKLHSSTLNNILLGILHPSAWIREKVKSILIKHINTMEPYENYSILRNLVLNYLDFPSNSVSLITTEALIHLYPPLLRMDFCTESHLPLFKKKIIESFKSKDALKPFPFGNSDLKYQVFEENFLRPKKKLSLSIDSPKVHESLSLKGNLQGCFNEHDCSVTNIAVIENSQAFLSASSDGTLKLWNLSQLDPFKLINSEQFFKSKDKPWKIKSIGSCGEDIFIAHEQGIIVSSLLKFSEETVYKTGKVLKAVGICENNIAAIDQQGLLSIFDIREKEAVQQYKLGQSYGLASSLCKGSTNSILGLGTLSSAVLVYDIRLVCPSIVYYHSSGLPIMSMQSYNNSSILVGADDIVLLDLHTGNASMVLTAYNPNPIIVPTFKQHLDHEWKVKNCANISHRTRKTFENPNTIRKIISPAPPYVISGGHDCLVRCWDLETPSKSFIIGQDPSLKPSFSEIEFPDVRIIQEKPFISNPLSYTINKSIKRKEYVEIPNHRKCSHTDVILDIALLNQHKTILLTASRDGTIKAWN